MVLSNHKSVYSQKLMHSVHFTLTLKMETTYTFNASATLSMST
jgi:hypothetical protein